MAKAKPIDVDLMRKMFRYDNGHLYSKTYNRKNPIGSFNISGYMYTRVKRKNYYIHRIIYAIVHGIDPIDSHIDHINGNPSDNRVENLRLATNSENMKNQKKAMRHNKLGVLGVHISKHSYERGSINFYEAQIAVNGKNKYLGMYPTVEKASEAYQVARKQLFGEFA